jgi:transcription initiation factor TFIIIB Brf1 subunit/transcription initiation factor TFIIB
MKEELSNRSSPTQETKIIYKNPGLEDPTQDTFDEMENSIDKLVSDLESMVEIPFIMRSRAFDLAKRDEVRESLYPHVEDLEELVDGSVYTVCRVGKIDLLPEDFIGPDLPINIDRKRRIAIEKNHLRICEITGMNPNPARGHEYIVRLSKEVPEISTNNTIQQTAHRLVELFEKHGEKGNKSWKSIASAALFIATYIHRQDLPKSYLAEKFKIGNDTITTTLMIMRRYKPIQDYLSSLE